MTNKTKHMVIVSKKIVEKRAKKFAKKPFQEITSKFETETGETVEGFSTTYNPLSKGEGNFFKKDPDARAIPNCTIIGAGRKARDFNKNAQSKQKLENYVDGEQPASIGSLDTQNYAAPKIGKNASSSCGNR